MTERPINSLPTPLIDMKTIEASLAEFTNAEIQAELDRRVHARETENRRQMDRLIAQNRLRNAVDAGRDSLERASTDLARREAALAGLEAQGVRVRAEDVILYRVRVEQAHVSVASATAALAEAQAAWEVMQ